MEFELPDFQRREKRKGPKERGAYAAVACVVALSIACALGYAQTAMATHAESADLVEDNLKIENNSDTGKTIAVHVSGAVENPGVYEMKQGDRVADAITAAGGFDEEAAEESLNLARQLVDGEHVVVKTCEQFQDASDNVSMHSEGRNSLVSINDASKAKLEELPGIGPVMAEKIIAYREKHGPFRKLTDLMNVPGVGQARFDALSDLICL